jgi:ADP-ribose pyrophosphatase YjhB (NUDIX family)
MNEKDPSPRLRITSVIKDGEKYLLIKERIASMDNGLFWLSPGGGVEYMETLEKAVIREAKEETGLNVAIIKFLTFIERIVPEKKFHIINFIYLVNLTGGELKKEKNAVDIGWFTKQEALKLDLTPSTRDVFMNYLG